tara:strand:+ start:2218 stop:3159 length:942 start_codon:yes stop_codon:yes gene_type:complete
MEQLKRVIDQSPFQLYRCDTLQYYSLLGEGASAKVYHVNFNNKEYAAKVYEDTEYVKFYDDFIYELNIAERLKDNKYCITVHCIGYTFENEKIKIILFMDLLRSYGDLYDYIQNIADWNPCYQIKGKLVPQPKTNYIYFNRNDNVYWCYRLSKVQKIRITKFILQAVNKLHSDGIIHGDIKTNNMALHYEYKKEIIKLIDFGMSYISKTNKLIIMDYKSGTPGYRAPEQEKYKINFSSDIYSVGVTIIELWNGDIWKNGNTFSELRKEVLEGLQKIKSNHKEFASLLRRCILYNHQERPDIKKVLQLYSNISF